jgi:hypothetical protein
MPALIISFNSIRDFFCSPWKIKFNKF